MTEALPEKLQKVAEAYRGQVPVPVVAIANDLGLEIYETADLEPNEAGFFRTEGDAFIVYLNSSHDLARQRFTVGSAIMWYLKRPHAVTEEGVVESTDQPIGHGRQAAALLMPELEFTEAWKATVGLEELAAQFEVPVGAAAIRGSDLFNVVRI